MKTPTVNRRDVLAGAGAFVLGFWLPPRAAQAQTAAGARRRLVHGARRYPRSTRGSSSSPTTPCRAHRADGARAGRLDVERDDGLRRAAVRLEQGAADLRVREPRRARDGAGVDARGARQRRDGSERRRRADVRQPRAHGRLRHSRQPLSAHAHERGVVGQGWPLLLAARGRRGARAPHARGRESVGRRRRTSSRPRTASSRTRRAAARRPTARSPRSRRARRIRTPQPSR